MKYLCLVYFEEKIWEEMSESTALNLSEESTLYDQELQNSGHYIAAEALESVHTATSVRMRNGKLSVSDGPFSETKEVLGGFILIDAVDLNEAIKVASKIPLARVGTIEVRPVLGRS